MGSGFWPRASGVFQSNSLPVRLTVFSDIRYNGLQHDAEGRMAHGYIGLSGYSYKPWQGSDRFYPPGLRQADFLRYYSTRFRSEEHTSELQSRRDLVCRL